MIFESGREIKEIYLGDKPVSAVYIGSLPIWRSREYMEGAAVIVLTSDALLKLVDGVSYSVESVGASAVSAAADILQSDVGKGAAVGFAAAAFKPYMRHIAPMLAKDSLPFISEVLPDVFYAELSKASENGLPIHCTRGKALSGTTIYTVHSASGIHESVGKAADGGSTYFVMIGAPPTEINITGGEGCAPRPINIGSAVQSISAVPGEADIGSSPEAAAAVESADAFAADMKRCKEFSCMSGLHDISRTIAGIDLISIRKLPLTIAGEVRTLYAVTERQDVFGQFVWVLTEMRPSISPSIFFECKYQQSTAVFAAKSCLCGTGREKTAVSFSGACSAGITLREQTEIDETYIYDLYMMSVDEIDLLTVKTTI